MNDGRVFNADNEESKLHATRSNRMTTEEIAAFTKLRLNGYLATHRSDGLIQVTPVWCLYEDGQIIFALGDRRRHQRNLLADPTATMLIEHDDRLEHGFAAGAVGVMLAGRVTKVDSEELIAEYDQKMAQKYLGHAADDPEFTEAVSEEVFHTWTLTPDRVVSWNFTKRAD